MDTRVYCGKSRSRLATPRGGGGDSHMKVTGMLVVSLRGKLQILVSLRVFRTESQYFYP